jgi:hypothetical protein
MKHSNCPSCATLLWRLLMPLAGMAKVRRTLNADAAYSAKGADTCLSCRDDDIANGVFHTSMTSRPTRAPIRPGQPG